MASPYADQPSSGLGWLHEKFTRKKLSEKLGKSLFCLGRYLARTCRNRRLWHYQHFYMPSAGDFSLVNRSAQPFFTELKFFYLHGHAAVHLFWVISGFIFASIYAASPKTVTVAHFAVNRFARLYPLHFITLLVVTLLQIFAVSAVGHYQIYPANESTILA